MTCTSGQSIPPGYRDDRQSCQGKGERALILNEQLGNANQES